MADAHHLPFNAEVFDCVLVHTALDHFIYPFKVLKEIYRVTRKHILITVGNSNYWGYSFNKFPSEHLHQWNLSVLTNLLAKAGFQVEEYGYGHLRRVGLREQFFRFAACLLLGFEFKRFKRRSLRSFFNDVLIVKGVKQR